MDDVEWYLCCDADETVISTSTDICDLIKTQRHIDRETRITDSEPDYHDDRPDESDHWDSVSSI